MTSERPDSSDRPHGTERPDSSDRPHETGHPDSSDRVESGRGRRRILFVDDEPRILQGIQRMLRTRRREWEVEAVESGREALARMAERPFDVLVTDMRMPEMDGAALLAVAQTLHPGTIRIVLSGYADRAAALRSILVAHQFASKPFAAEDLVATLDRACSLSDLIHDDRLRDAVGSVELLPQAPQIYRQCVTILQDEESPLERITRVIEREPALAAKILQVVNSAFFGLPQRTSDLARAIAYLGTETVEAIVLAMEAMRIGEDTAPVGPISLTAVSDASVLAARLTRHLPGTDGQERQHIYTAALLHDIGYLTLLAHQPVAMARVVALAETEAVPFAAASRRLGQPEPARVGAYLLGAWGLPLGVLEAVRDQDGADAPRARLTDAVHLVDRAAKIALGELHGADAFTRVTVDPAVLTEAGAGGVWERLLDEARALVAEGGAAAA